MPLGNPMAKENVERRRQGYSKENTRKVAEKGHLWWVEKECVAAGTGS